MNPYQNLSENSFWATGVAKRNMFDINGLWKPKFRIGARHRVVTFGSCFAQHFGRALAGRGFSWHITEVAPSELSSDNCKIFNYGVFSARTGNIYTSSLLHQWLKWAANEEADPKITWEKDGRFFDPFRPAIEPNGFSSTVELFESRKIAIESFKLAVQEASIFVFTMGLTESWFNTDEGFEYPMCPGTIAGTYDPSAHKFVNQGFVQVRNSMVGAIRLMRKLNPRIKILLTVSPVPLTATMSGNHVLSATVESKSVLRAVAGELRNSYQFVDYFPSYEIISGTPYRGSFFEPNQRSVNHFGVKHVMDSFFNCLIDSFPDIDPGKINQTLSGISNEGTPNTPIIGDPPNFSKNSDEVCEELLLNRFSPT